MWIGLTEGAILTHVRWNAWHFIRRPEFKWKWTFRGFSEQRNKPVLRSLNTLIFPKFHYRGVPYFTIRNEIFGYCCTSNAFWWNYFACTAGGTAWKVSKYAVFPWFVFRHFSHSRIWSPRWLGDTKIVVDAVVVDMVAVINAFVVEIVVVGCVVIDFVFDFVNIDFCYCWLCFLVWSKLIFLELAKLLLAMLKLTLLELLLTDYILLTFWQILLHWHLLIL